MLHDVWGGARMALRRWPRMVALGGMIAIAGTAIALVLSDVMLQLSVLRGGQELRNRHAVVFTPYYQSGSVTSVDDATVERLVADIRGARAYTAVVFNVQVDNPDFADGIPTLMLFGDVLDDVFPDLELCRPAPCAMRGSRLASRPVAPVEIGGSTVPITGVLRPSAAFFDVHLGGVRLDDRLVLRLPAESLLFVDAIEREEALSRAVMLGANEDRVDEYLSGAAAGGLYLVPHDVAVHQPRRLAEVMVVSAVYVAGLGAFLGLVLFAFASSAAATIRRERRALVIRRMYGARPLHVVARVGGFVALVVLALPLPMLAALRSLGDPVAGGAVVVIYLMFAIFVVLWARSTRNVMARELRDR